jgi:hypothetical protein
MDDMTKFIPRATITLAPPKSAPALISQAQAM